jgi:hypothetical protein
MAGVEPPLVKVGQSRLARGGGNGSAGVALRGPHVVVNVPLHSAAARAKGSNGARHDLAGRVPKRDTHHPPRPAIRRDDDRVWLPGVAFDVTPDGRVLAERSMRLHRSLASPR